MSYTKFALSLAVSLSVLTGTGCQEAKPKDAKQQVSEKWHAARAGVQYSLAKQSYESGDVETARKNIDQSLALNPKFAAAHILSAKLYIEKGQLDRAEAALTEAAKLEPKNPEPDYCLGVVHQRWKNSAKALEFYTAAAEKAPTEPAFILAKAETLVSLDKSADAVALLESKVTFFESSAAVRDLLGQLYQQQGKFSDAATLFRQASMLNPDDLSLRERLSMALFYAKQYQDASDRLAKLTQTEPYNRRGDLMAALGVCYAQLNRPRDARTAYESAARYTPAVPAVWLGLARAALKLDDVTRADLALRRATVIAPDSPQAHLLTGYLRLRQDRPADALSSFAKASQLDARDTVAMCMLGYVQEKLGNRDQAIRHYAQALKVSPGDEFASKLMASVDLHE